MVLVSNPSPLLSFNSNSKTHLISLSRFKSWILILPSFGIIWLFNLPSIFLKVAKFCLDLCFSHLCATSLKVSSFSVGSIPWVIWFFNLMASCLAVASDISGYCPIVYFLILPLILILQRKVLLFGRILTIRLGVLSSFIISSFVSCGRVIAFS